MNHQKSPYKKEVMRRLGSLLRTRIMNGPQKPNRVISISGTLQPANQKVAQHKFQLRTRSSVLSLEAPKHLSQILEKNLWERVLIEGTYSGEETLRIRKIRIMREKAGSLEDPSKSFDIEFYKRIIKHGFSIEPITEEFA